MQGIRVFTLSVLVLALVMTTMTRTTSARSLGELGEASTGRLLRIVERAVDANRFKRDGKCDEYAKGKKSPSPACRGYSQGWLK